MKVYDCCMFWNENDLFEIRLNTHWNYVDYFVVVEAGETHTGLPKPMNFDHERFKPWASKIVYRSFDKFEDAMAQFPELLDDNATSKKGSNQVTEDWTRDHFQGNYIFKVLKEIGADDNDIVYISCCDELIKEQAINECTSYIKSNPSETPVFMFQFYLYAYKFNLLNKHWSETDSTGLLTKMSALYKTLPATLRGQRMATHLIRDAGWHFTFMDRTDGEMVLAKQRAWAHSKDVYPGKKTKFEHTSKLEALERLFEDYQLSPVDIKTETHPEYIVNNQEKFKDYILEWKE